MNYSTLYSQQTNITSFPEINRILESFSTGIQNILDTNLKGLYLFGSLTYGDFRNGSSDIDLVAIVKSKLDDAKLEAIKTFHQEIAKKFPIWRERIECSYTPEPMLSSLIPPKEPRPWYGGDVFYAEADYGNEWIINNYLLCKNGIALLGPCFRELINPIDIYEVQKACINDLFTEWVPKVKDFEWLDNSHYQSYLILNLCRILYTVFRSETASKIISAAWVKKTFPQWESLIEAAENWEYGMTMNRKEEAIDFIFFAVNAVRNTELFGSLDQNEIHNRGKMRWNKNIS